jgi:hypothetical protein
MQRRPTEFWVGVSGVVVLVLVFGGLLLRIASRGSGSGVATGWDSYTADGDTLSITFSGTPCDEADRVVLDEQDERRVVVTVYLRTSEQVCVASAVAHQTEARLDDPLGDRQVYDGACLRRPGNTEGGCLRSAG